MSKKGNPQICDLEENIWSKLRVTYKITSNRQRQKQQQKKNISIIIKGNMYNNIISLLTNY